MQKGLEIFLRQVDTMVSQENPFISGNYSINKYIIKSGKKS